MGTEVIKAIAQKYQTNNQIGKATIEANSNGIVRIYTTDFEEKGEISTYGGVLTWKGITSNTWKTILTEEPGPTIADITVDDYGTYINIGTNLLGKNNTTEADWRVFYKDTNGAWLILADYLPVNSGVGASIVSTVGLKTVGLVPEGEEYQDSYIYSVFSNDSRQDLITKLSVGNWSGLIVGSDVAGETGVIVKGAVDLPTWVASWNANEGYTSLTATQNETGYQINEENYISLDEGNSNSLFFPHQEHVAVGGCRGYWLASPSAYNDSYVMSVDACSVYLMDDNYGSPEYNGWSYGVRPVVYLPSNISLDTTGNVWTIAE